MIIRNRKNFSTSAIDTLPIGAIYSWPGLVAPIGYLMLLGQEVSKARYAKLYLIVGDTFAYGRTPTSGMFFLPDLSGKTVVGVSTLDAEFNALGKLFGSKIQALTIAQLASHGHIQNAHNHLQDSHNHSQNAHNHTQDAHGHTFQFALNNGTAGIYRYCGIGTATGTQLFSNSSIGSGEVPWGIGSSQPGIYNNTASNNATTATNQNAIATNNTAGSGEAHNNIQPSIALNYIVKAEMIGNLELNNIYDGLDSNSPTQALSANQGKVLDTKINTKQDTIIDSGWITPTLVNTWISIDANRTVRYRKIGKIVYITGVCKAGASSASNQEIFTLPVGFRPEGMYLSSVQRASTSTCRIHINYQTANSGVVAFEGLIADAGEVSLFNISFIADN